MAKKTELTDQEFVENIVKAIVDHPDDVVTSRSLDDRGVLIQLTVNPEDMGKVIGREGRTAKAIRSLLRVFGARQEERVNLKIVDPNGDVTSIPEDGNGSSEPMTTPVETPMAEPATEPIAEMPLDQAEDKPVEEKATGVI